MYKTKEEVENWLNQMEIENYVINEDLTVDVNGDVDLSFKKIRELPIQLGIINGNFYCYYNYFTNLKGCPIKVNGSFNCSNNHLTSLEGCPEVINGNLNCNSNKLKDFRYFPKEINGDFIHITKNKIKEEELVNFNCDIKNIKEICSDFNKDGNKDGFLEKVHFYKSKKENELLTEISKNINNIKLNKKL